MIEVMLDASAWKDVDPGVEALLDKWLVSPGDPVRQGQALAQVVVVKSNQEVTAPCNGQVDSILVQAGDTFDRSKPLARLQEAA